MKTLIKMSITLGILLALQFTVFAQSEVEEQPDYYLIAFDDLAQWMLEIEADHAATLPDETVIAADTATDEKEQTLLITLETVKALFAENWSDVLVTAAESPTMVTLETLHTLLAEMLEAPEDTAQQSFSVCLAVDNNPYSITGPGLYFYLELPASPKDYFPVSWEPLSAPRNDSPTWSTECFDGQADMEPATSRSA